MKKPVVVERFADNGAHSHWELIDADTGAVLWAEAVQKPASAEKTETVKDVCVCENPKTTKIGNFCYGCNKYTE